MDTIIMIIFIMIGIASGIMLGLGTIMGYVVKSNDIGNDTGKAYDFKIYSSEHILVKDDGHRILGRSSNNVKREI